MGTFPTYLGLLWGDGASGTEVGLRAGASQWPPHLGKVLGQPWAGA